MLEMYHSTSTVWCVGYVLLMCVAFYVIAAISEG